MIPAGWKSASLADICNFIEKGKRKASFGKNRGQFIFVPSALTTKYCDEADYVETSIVLGDGGVANVHYVDTPFSASDHTYILREKDKSNVVLKYVYYNLLANIEHIQKGFGGAAIKNVSKTYLKNTPIIYPDLPEQQRIVEKLDALLADIEKGKQIIQHNLQDVTDVFYSQLNNGFKNMQHTIKCLGELALVTSGYAFKSADFKPKGDYQVIRLGNVKQGCLRLISNPVYVSDLDESIKEKCILDIGDVVITQTGTKNKRDYGYVAIVDTKNILLNQRLARVRCSEMLLPGYFYYFSYTDLYKDNFFRNEGGAVGQGNVGLNDIKLLPIPYVDIDKQRTFVQQLDDLREQTQELEQIYTQQIADLDELKQAILKKAFNGEL